ncbi:chorismate mutase [Candidatus Pacearchaeota archaeon]|nr:chorismate mutase [Candidatus Pacearchaeota archaeon]
MRIDKEEIKEMQRCRREIDRIDNKILCLLSSRIKIVKKIKKIKKQNNIKIIDRKREKEIFSKLIKKCSGLDLNKRFVMDLFKRIIKQSRKDQR